MRVWLAVNFVLVLLPLALLGRDGGWWLGPGGLRSAGSNSFGAAAFCCWLSEALPWGAAAAAHFLALSSEAGSSRGHLPVRHFIP